MDKEEVIALLERYYEGTATAEEERRLRRFLLAADVPEEFAAEQAYFQALAAARRRPAPALEERLAALVDERLGGGEHRMRRMPRAMRRTLPLAAALLAGAFLYFFVATQRPRDTYQDPRLAWHETRRVLLYVSEKLNEGTRTLSYLDELSLPAREMQKVERATAVLDRLPLLQFPAPEEEKRGKSPEKRTNQ